MFTVSQRTALAAQMRDFSAKVRARGQQYAQAGRVGALQVDGECVRAAVRGTDIYETLWEWSGDYWEPDCSCPVGPYCKHAYALASCMVADGVVSSGAVKPPAATRAAGAAACTTRWRAGERRAGEAALDAGALGTRALLHPTCGTRGRRRLQLLLAAVSRHSGGGRSGPAVLAIGASDSAAGRRLAAAGAGAVSRPPRPRRTPCAARAAQPGDAIGAVGGAAAQDGTAQPAARLHLGGGARQHRCQRRRAADALRARPMRRGA